MTTDDERDREQLRTAERNLAAALHERDQRIAELETELETRTNELYVMTESFEVAKRNVRELLDGRDGLEVDLAEVRKERDDLEARVAELWSDLAEVGKERDGLELALSALVRALIGR